MAKIKKTGLLKILLYFLILWAIGIGTALGISLAQTINIETFEDVGKTNISLSSKLLDKNDKLITEYFSEQKRELVSIDKLPKHLIYALLTREDQEFYHHNGFSFKNTMRALINIVLGRYVSGGSTITQQVAGTLYADRNEFSLSRKLRELWWAFQLERNLTKDEILEIYLNTVYLGHGTYGVEAASQFYFGHSAKDLTLAESAVLVVQLSSPGYNSPINHPERAKLRQWAVLEEMAKLGYITKEEAKQSYDNFWKNFNYTRTQNSSVFVEKQDKAPYFSEYVRQQLEQKLLGTFNIYKDGFTIHTTLNLDYQKLAEEYFTEGLELANKKFKRNQSTANISTEEKFIPILDMLAISFDMPKLSSGETRRRIKAKKYATKELLPLLETTAGLFNLENMGKLIEDKNQKILQEQKKNSVEGALITLENDTGYIVAMIGGSKFGPLNQFNRAVQAKVQPGSSFKPIYYSAAISSKKFTPATLIYDGPVVFWNDDGTPYKPLNYRGEWKGYVTVRTALSHSMNVPSIKVLDAVGFDAAIDRASKLLGIDDPVEIAKTFPRKYPLGLGIISVSPIQMARAYAIFANQGKEVNPVAIRYVEDRSGKIIWEPEKELRESQKKKGDSIYVISPQTAYIMTSLLQTTVESGTLRYARSLVGGFNMPMAGKTGTTQNWSDVWTVGFSPYYTTAVWFGFDQQGHSLGVNQTGAVTTGPVWAKYMKAIHENLPPKDFKMPTKGIVKVKVTEHGLLPPPGYPEDKIREEVFIAGTEPKEFDKIVEFQKERNEITEQKILNSVIEEDLSLDTSPDSLGLELDPELKAILEGSVEGKDNAGNTLPDDNPDYNPLLD
ncbi:PBP1A family penicillin-binding protein [Spirochaetia bacterium 38H-sp]|uniref:peptidoglycan glycosyltransferase n=1 Tax=Rarispira pelagica TaxID=3141764 RepID=A0ABU9UB15_9SPIR